MTEKPPVCGAHFHYTTHADGLVFNRQVWLRIYCRLPLGHPSAHKGTMTGSVAGGHVARTAEVTW